MNTPNVLSFLIQYAKEQPNKHAIYLINSKDITIIDEKITYSELLLCVCKLAEELKAKTTIGDRVILCYATGIDYVVAFYACLWAQVIPVTLTVPNNAALVEKFLAIYNDCLPMLILTDKNNSDNCSALNIACEILVTDYVKYQNANVEPFALPIFAPEDLAFLQYTSGSVSSPKGVMISHGNLLSNLESMSQAFNSQKDWVGVNWLPHTHDMGLIGSFLHSVYKGAEIYLMPPSMIIRRPLSWLQATSLYRANITGGPCFILKMCLDSWDETRLEGLDLSAMKHIVIGSEPINIKVVKEFFNTLEAKGLSSKAFTPAYGLAEATLMVSLRSGFNILQKSEYSESLISCGRAYQNLRIVSPDKQCECAEDEIGEIWINGPSVAQGYWQNHYATEDAFGGKLPGDNASYFKTGDLGFLHAEELYVVGRIKEVIIINGVNYYPQDIERSILAADDILKTASCAVFRWRPKDAFVDSFVVFIKANKRCSPEIQEDLIIAIKKHLLKTYHLIPFDIKFVSFSFPKTTSGKLQRHICATLYEEQCAQKDTA